MTCCYTRTSNPTPPHKITDMDTLTEEDKGLSISKEELNELEAETMPLPVEVITRDTPDEELQRACTELAAEVVLGFDTETKPVFQRGLHNAVALLQLSTPQRAYLFRLNTFESTDRLAPLQALLASKEILKVGVAIQDDCKELYRDHGLVTNYTLDLRYLASANNMEVRSLSKIYALLFGKRLTKGQRLTDWQQPELTPGQIEYAGLDAYAGLRIYTILSELTKPEMINKSLLQSAKKKGRKKGTKPSTAKRKKKS